jgi:RNA polymerase sigma-70 factor (ECF subfamily)
MRAGTATTPTDADVLGAVAEGDADALRVLFDRHATWLTLRLGRRCADRDVVDDAVQDTFVEVWRHASRYEGRGDVAAWIWGIAVRRLIDGLRRRPRLAIAPRAEVEQVAQEEQILLGVEYGDLGSALNRLSPELRAVVQATVLGGLTMREAGRLLGIPAGTVKTRMMRARAQLREAIA